MDRNSIWNWFQRMKIWLVRIFWWWTFFPNSFMNIWLNSSRPQTRFAVSKPHNVRHCSVDMPMLKPLPVVQFHSQNFQHLCCVTWSNWFTMVKLWLRLKWNRASKPHWRKWKSEVSLPQIQPNSKQQWLRKQQPRHRPDQRCRWNQHHRWSNVCISIAWIVRVFPPLFIALSLSLALP